MLCFFLVSNPFQTMRNYYFYAAVQGEWVREYKRVQERCIGIYNQTIVADDYGSACSNLILILKSFCSFIFVCLLTLQFFLYYFYHCIQFFCNFIFRYRMASFYIINFFLLFFVKEESLKWHQKKMEIMIKKNKNIYF